MHLVGVYQGATEGQKDSPWWKNCAGLQNDRNAMAECHQKYAGQRSMRNVVIEVGYSAKPMVLVLMAYEPVKWKMALNPGARIEKIIISGYHGQDIEGIPESVRVEARSHKSSPCLNCTRQSEFFHAYNEDSQEYRETVKKLERITGLVPASFQGSYEGSRFSIVGGHAKPVATDKDQYVGKSFRDQVQLAGHSVSLPEGVWQGIAIHTGPSLRGPDKILALARTDQSPLRSVLFIRFQKATDGNGFPKFTGCSTKPNHGGETKINESFGHQICYEIHHVSPAWSQDFLAQTRSQLARLRPDLPETVLASSYHKADLSNSIDLLFYQLPEIYPGMQGEAWDTSPWHPNNLKPNSPEALVVQQQVRLSSLWFQMLNASL